MAAIKNIIFDLGGVVLNIDLKASSRAFNLLFQDHGKEMLEAIIKTGALDLFETGKMNEIEFMERVSLFFNKKVQQSKLYDAWVCMLLDFPKERVDFIEELKRNYKVFLLSNTNILHHRVFNQRFAKEFPYQSLDSFFYKAYYSFEMGLRKPNPAIFKTVLADSGILAHETLFIDDFAENIETAQQLGFKTFLHPQNGDLKYIAGLLEAMN